MDVDAEQRLHDLEQRHVSLKKEYDLVLIDKESLKSKVASLQSFLDQNAQQISQADRRVSDHALELSQKDKLVQDLSAANEELNDRCRRRSDECDRLRDDLKAQAAELVTLQTRLKDSQSNFNEYQTSTLPTQYELTKTLHEKDRFAEQVRYLEEELQKKTREERALRAESGDAIHQLEQALSQANGQLEDAAKQLAALKDLTSNQQEKIDFYMSKLHTAESSAVEKQGAFTSEIEGLKRLVDLYKRYFEEASAKVADLEQHEAVIRETNANVLKSLRDKISLQVTESEAAAEKERAEWAAKVKDLEQQLQQAQQAQQSSLSMVQFIEGGASSSSTCAHAGAHAHAGSVLAVENFDGVGMTEMYDRIVQTEKELFAERSKRREVELYMQQILKDVESKAPIIAAQRRDYHRVVESHTALTRRLDLLVVENADLKGRVKMLQQCTDTAVESAQVLEEHNADLSRQIQHLLQRSMGVQFGSAGSRAAQVEPDEPNTPGGVISQYMVTFDDIRELQQRNAELLQVVRKLSREEERSHQLQITAGDDDAMEVSGPSGASASPGAALTPNKGTPGKGNAALQAALEELSNMREARKRTEEMVTVLAQQRDMYRAMAEGDASVFPVSSPSAKSPAAGLFGAPTPSASADAPATPSASSLWGSAQVRELQSKLTQAEEERRRVQERMARFEEAEQLLNENLDKVRKEATAARLEAAQGTSEARFQKERAERLESTLQNTQQESASALQRRLELERTLLSANKEVRSREDRIAELQDQLRASQDSQRRAEIDAEVAKSAETRLIAQIAEAREETRRHVALVEHINRIESGLQGRSEAEREALLAENEALKASYDTLRKQLDDRTLLDEQRAKVAEEEIRSIRTRLEQKTAELASISEQLAREQITANAAQERGNLLERQLSIAQERLTHTQGSQIIETSIANDYTAKELALERAQAEIEALKQQVTSTESHAEQFRKISAANETALKDLRAKVAAAQAEQEAEVARMRAELEAAQKDVQDSRVNSQGLLQEAEDAREQLRAFTAESAEKVRKLEETITLQQHEIDQLRAQGASMSGEIVKFQDAARAAHQNYERELQMHASAERDLSEQRRLLHEAKAALLQEQQRAAQLSTDCIRKEAQLSDERSRYQQESRDMREQLTGLHVTNDLLHTQVQSYGLQIERLHEQRLLHAGVSSASAHTAGAATQPVEASQMDTAMVSDSEALAMETQPLETDAATAVAQVATSSAAAAAPPAPTSEAADAPYDELAELRKSTSEMREVLRYMKREKDMLQAKLSVAETENSRLVSELQTIRRALDEVKVELKRELDKRTPLRSADDFNRLMAEVNQLNIVRESNLHLRAENEELSKRATALANSLTEAKDAAAPLEDTIRKLKAEKESLEMVNDQLTNDVAYWRSRLQTLISRYNDVDPEEHRLLKTKLEEVTASLAEVQQALVDQRKTSEEAAAESNDTKDKEIASLKAQVSGAETSANKLRDALRAHRERFEAVNARLKDSEAKLAAEKTEKCALETQLAEAATRIETLNASIAAVNAAKSQVESQLAKAGGAVPTEAGAAGAAATTPANRRKRPPPPAGAQPTPVADATAGATPVAVPAVAGVTAVEAPAVTSAVASASIPAPAVAPAATPAVTTAATTAADDKKAAFKEALMRKRAAQAAAPAAPATAAVTAPSADAAVAVTGKRAAPADTAATASADSSASTDAVVAGNAPKRRRPAPAAGAPAVATPVIATTTAAPVASVVVQDVAAVVAPVSEPAATEETVEMTTTEQNEGVIDLVSESEATEMPVPEVVPTTAAPAAEAPAPTLAEAAAPSKANPKIGAGNPFAFGFGSTASAFKTAPIATETEAATESKTATSPPKSIFGSAQTGPFSAPAVSTGGLFGGISAFTSTTPTAATASPWGAAKGLNAGASAFAPAASGFGNFGAAAPAAATTTNLFATGVAKATFGAPAVAAGASSLFGAAKPATTSAFGALASAPALVKTTSFGGQDSAITAPFSAPASTVAAAPAVVATAPVVASQPAVVATSTAPIAAISAAPAETEQQKREARAARFAQQQADAEARAAAASAVPSKAVPVLATAPVPAVQALPTVVEVDEAEVDAFLQSTLEQPAQEQHAQEEGEEMEGPYEAQDDAQEQDQEYENDGDVYDTAAGDAAGAGDAEEGEEMEEGEV